MNMCGSSVRFCMDRNSADVQLPRMQEQISYVQWNRARDKQSGTYFAVFNILTAISPRLATNRVFRDSIATGRCRAALLCFSRAWLDR